MGRKLALAGVAAFFAGSAYATAGRSSQLLGKSAFRGSKYLPQLALTFDDGPTPSTAKLLDVLDQFGVAATFFQCGIRVRQYPEIARAVLAAGHELGNHTDTHPRLWTCSAPQVIAEIRTAQRSIVEHTGATPRWFRPPYGVRWFGLRGAQRELGLTTLMWTGIGSDWRLPAAGVVGKLLPALQNGAVLCLHDGRGTESDPDISSTIQAVRELIPRALDSGLRFRTASQLFSGDPKSIG